MVLFSVFFLSLCMCVCICVCGWVVNNLETLFFSVGQQLFSCSLLILFRVFRYHFRVFIGYFSSGRYLFYQFQKQVLFLVCFGCIFILFRWVFWLCFGCFCPKKQYFPDYHSLQGAYNNCICGLNRIEKVYLKQYQNH